MADRHVESEISLLREYRTRLIADVVTGKVDVREAAAGSGRIEEQEPLEETDADVDADAADDIDAIPEEASMTTDTSERGLERLICTALTGSPCDPGTRAVGEVEQRPSTYGVGWIGGVPEDYDREYCVDLEQLSAFLHETQPEVAEHLELGQDGPTRRKFLSRLQGEISKRGTIDVLRHGIKHGAHHLDLFYGTPSPGNKKAKERYEANRFSVTRQFRYSRDETQLALDLGLFINGLPIATFELKNSLTKQTVEDAIQQYKRDRDPREKLFEFGRCVAHIALDEHEVRFCTQLKGKARGSCRSISVGATARAIRPTRTGSRPIICGSASSRGTA